MDATTKTDRTRPDVGSLLLNEEMEDQKHRDREGISRDITNIRDCGKICQIAFFVGLGLFLYQFSTLNLAFNTPLLLIAALLIIVGFFLILKEIWQEEGLPKILQVHNQMLAEEMKRQREKDREGPSVSAS